MTEEKRALRKQIRETKRQFTQEELRRMSASIMERLLAHPAVTSADTILMYYSLPDEVYTHEAVRRLAKAGKTVLLPKVISDSEMEVRLYRSDADLAEGSYGIMEPTGALFTDFAKIGTAVVPGMGFDSAGRRLGRGKGYYDRFLPKILQAFKIGVCFDFQKLPSIPADDNDVNMDCVI